MNEISRKTGYLQGLIERSDSLDGAELKKLFSVLCDLLTDMAAQIAEHDELIEDLNDYAESIDDDLSALENDRNTAGTDYDDEEPACTEGLRLVDNANREGPVIPDIQAAGWVCPRCSGVFLAALSDAPGSRYICPNCGNKVSPLALCAENIHIIPPVID